MFDIKKTNIITKKNKNQKVFITGASIAAIVASGDASSNWPILSNAALSVSVAENQSAVVKVEATGGVGLTFAISGADSALFNIDAASGTLSFIASPNFEAPADAGADNVYNVDVTVTNSGGFSSMGTVVITVTNVNDAGIVSISGAFKQGETLTANVNDDEGLTGVVIGYQWQRDGVDIGGEIATTYTLVKEDVGAEIKAVATYTDEAGNAEVVQSDATSVVTIGSSMALVDLNGNNGFRINGIDGGDQAGRSVSSAGDINGDGFDDFIIGAAYADPVGPNRGLTHVVFGKAGGFSTLELSSLDGNNGFSISGTDTNSYSGWSVSGAGDVNGDGYDDIAIGVLNASPNSNLYSGSTYVMFGKAGGFGDINLSALTGNSGFRIDGVATDDESGRSVSNAGDVNGDGYDDIIIGAHHADNTNANSGSSYVVFGKASGFGTVALSSLSGNDGFRIDGTNLSDISGYSVSAAGDVNGDGYDDVIIGAYLADNSGTNSGSSYVVFGKAGGFGTVALASLNGGDGFRIDGVANGDKSGFSVAAAGDVNGDGYDDVIIGAYQVDNTNTDSGSSYVVFGKASWFATVNLSALNGNNGFRIDGVTGADESGYSVAAAGDVNGDGYDDVIVGAPYADPSGSQSGSSYVVFGKAGGFGTVALSALNGSDGFRIDGVVGGDQSGYSVSGAGDVNGDGYDDIIIGAYNADINGNASGSSYVIFGGAQFAASAQAATAGDDVLTGSAATDTLNGGDGNDSLTGLGGNDILKGGNGVDALNAGVGADRIWGGGGSDTFSFNAGDSVLAIGGSNDAGTISGYDIIYDFKVGDGTHVSETFDTVGTAIVAANGAVNGVNNVLKIDGSTVKSHFISNGVIVFDDDDTFNITLEISTEGEIAAVVQYLQLQNLGGAGTSVAFDVGADSFIFTQGADNGDDSQDILVRLEDVQVDSLITSNGIGAFDLFIA